MCAESAMALLGLLTMLLARAGTLYAQPPPNPNLPVFTSPIDVTGLPLVMRVSAPDRETGQLVDIPVPPGFLGPKFTRLLGSAAQCAVRQLLERRPDPTSGKTVRAVACDGPRSRPRWPPRSPAQATVRTTSAAISRRLAKSSSSRSVRRSSSPICCGTTPSPFQSTSTQTCSPNNGTVFCPNDPRFTVKFAIEIVTHAEGLAHLRAVCR